MKKLLPCSFLTKTKLLILGIVALFAANTSTAQVCLDSNTSPGSVVCAGDNLLWTSTSLGADPGDRILWEIVGDGTNGAVFTSTGTAAAISTVTGAVTPNINSILVTMGPQAGSVTVRMTFLDNPLPNSCSSSGIAKVIQVSGVASTQVCPGQTGTITATAGTQIVHGGPLLNLGPYTYTISPGGQSNQTGIFPGLAAGPYTVHAVDATGCEATTAVINVQTVAPNPIVLTCPANVTRGSCEFANQAAVDAAYQAFLNGFSFIGGIAPVSGSFVPPAPAAPLLCGGSVSVTYVVIDACQQRQECTRTFTVTAPIAPEITACPPGGDLGCNPTGLPAPVDPTVSSACAVTVSSSLGPIETNGCLRRQVRTYTVSNGCNQTDTCEQVFTWKVDITAPVITLVGLADIDLGVNVTPTDAEIEAAAGIASVFDACDFVLTHQDSPRVTVDCVVSFTRTFNAVDLCGNPALPVVRTIHWKIPGCELNGCTLGYWKTHTQAWNCYTTCTLYNSVFTSSTLNPNLTLLQALNLGGGGCNNLARQSVAALLNICEGLPYGVATTAGLIAQVNAAFENGTCGALGATLDGFNNEGGVNHCNVEKSPNTSAPSAACLVDNKTVTPKGDKATGAVAYPNPFRGNVSFDLYSTESGHATLEIFNLMGQRIATPFNGNIKAGETIEGVNVQINGSSETLLFKFSVNGKGNVGRIINQDQ